MPVFWLSLWTAQLFRMQTAVMVYLPVSVSQVIHGMLSSFPASLTVLYSPTLTETAD
jgi:hypothetical protein